MKKIITVLFAAVLLASCGGSDGKSLAKEVCDCNKKANAMDPADPKRATAQADCAKKQMDAWDKVKDDQKKADEFNVAIGECSKEMMKDAFGK